jgi:hypothetical protein
VTKGAVVAGKDDYWTAQSVFATYSSMLKKYIERWKVDILQ